MLWELSAAGHSVVAPARAFLAEFSGLRVISPDATRSLLIDGDNAARHADPDWCAAYADELGVAVTPVGEYSHMTLVLDAGGVFWGGFDADFGYLGEGIEGVIDRLLIHPGSRRLDREVEA